MHFVLNQYSQNALANIFVKNVVTVSCYPRANVLFTKSTFLLWFTFTKTWNFLSEQVVLLLFKESLEIGVSLMPLVWCRTTSHPHWDMYRM